LQEEFLSKLPIILQEKNVLDAPGFKTDVFFTEMHVFPKSGVCAYLEQAESTSTLKTCVTGSIPFINYLKSHRQTMCYMLFFYIIGMSFDRYKCFFNSVKGLF
jgi:hypothetical protein